MNIQHKLAAAVAVVIAAGIALTGCSSASGSADGSTGATSAKTATSASAFGGMDKLVEAANKEGQLNVIALPHDWANYGKILAAFKKKYPKITVKEASPDVSSAEEIQAAKTNQGLDTAPDVFDLGLTVALQNTDQFASYKVQTWKDIPAALKDSKGRFTGDYGGYMSIGYDSSKYPKPTSLNDLLKSAYKSAVSLNGDPTQAGAAFAAVGLATALKSGNLNNFQSGIDFFQKLNAAGNMKNVDVTTATVASGETPVVFDWDYLNATHTADNASWKTVILPGVGYASYYNQAINKDAPHPAAARLWQEFLYSDQGQNLWLQGGARPVRSAAMEKAGTIDKTALAKLPKAPAKYVIPTEKQSNDAGTLLGSKWAAAVGQ